MSRARLQTPNGIHVSGAGSVRGPVPTTSDQSLMSRAMSTSLMSHGSWTSKLLGLGLSQSKNQGGHGCQNPALEFVTSGPKQLSILIELARPAALQLLFGPFKGLSKMFKG